MARKRGTFGKLAVIVVVLLAAVGVWSISDEVGAGPASRRGKTPGRSPRR